jgi:hypothetical protein
LQVNFPEITQKIELLCGDVSTYNLSTLTSNSSDTLVWISNLCFGHELTVKVFLQILYQLAPGTIITCSEKPFQPDNSLDLSNSNKVDVFNKLKFIKTIQVKMSWWNKLSNVHIFQII